MKISSTIWYMASPDCVNLPKSLLGWSTKFNYHSILYSQRIEHQGQTGAQHLFASPGLLRWALRPPVLSGHPQRLSRHLHPTWSIGAETSKVKKEKRGKKKSLKNLYFRYYTSDSPYITTYLGEGRRRGSRFPTQSETEAEE